MKTVFTKLIALMLAGCLLACGKEADPETSGTALVIQESVLSQTFPCEGGETIVPFTARTAWTATVMHTNSALTWLSVSPESGEAGEAAITVIGKQTDSTEARTGFVKIRAGQEEAVIRVVQSGDADILTMTDAVFQAYCLENFDTNGDGILTKEEAQAVTAIDVSGRGIASLEGLEHFLNLTRLACADNELTTLDVSRNTALTYLYFNDNPLELLNLGDVCPETYTPEGLFYIVLTEKLKDSKQFKIISSQITQLEISANKLETLDVSECPAMKQLRCVQNNLASLDLRRNPNLTLVWCYSNRLTALDVRENRELATLYCHDNELTALDLENNSALTQLSCNNNKLTALDVSKNTKLTSLNCDENALNSLNVSGCTALNTLYCRSNQLTEVDLRENAALRFLYCNDNRLTSLDVSANGELRTLYCQSNAMTSLDVSTSESLNSLICYDNRLTELDITGTDIGIGFSTEPLDCAPMSSLQKLYVKRGSTVKNITPERNDDYLPAHTEIVYVD